MTPPGHHARETLHGGQAGHRRRVKILLKLLAVLAAGGGIETEGVHEAALLLQLGVHLVDGKLHDIPVHYVRYLQVVPDGAAPRQENLRGHRAHRIDVVHARHPLRIRIPVPDVPDAGLDVTPHDPVPVKTEIHREALVERIETQVIGDHALILAMRADRKPVFPGHRPHAQQAIAAQHGRERVGIAGALLDPPLGRHLTGDVEKQRPRIHGLRDAGLGRESDVDITEPVKELPPVEMTLVAVRQKPLPRPGMIDVVTKDVLLMHDGVIRKNPVGPHERTDDRIVPLLVHGIGDWKTQLPAPRQVAPLRDDAAVKYRHERQVIPKLPIIHDSRFFVQASPGHHPPSASS